MLSKAQGVLLSGAKGACFPKRFVTAAVDFAASSSTHHRREDQRKFLLLDAAKAFDGVIHGSKRSKGVWEFNGVCSCVQLMRRKGN